MNLQEDFPGDEGLFDRVCSRLDSAVLIYQRDTASRPSGFRIAAINRIGREIAALPPEADVVGSDLGEVFPRAGDMGLVAALERVSVGGDTETLPPLRYRDGARAGWYRNGLHCLAPGRVLAVLSDVTAEVEALERAQQTETRHDLLTRALADGIFDWDLENDTLYLSPAWKAQLGFADDELESVFSSWSERLHPDDREQRLRDLECFIDSDERVWDREFRLRHRDGRYIWIRARATALRDLDTGRARRLLGVHIDIDRQKRDRQEARRRQEIVETVVAALPDALLLLDREGTVLEYFAPDGGGPLTGSSEQLVGKPLEELLPERATAQYRRCLGEALDTRQLVTFDYRQPATQGDRHLEARVRVTPDARYVAMIVRDITADQLAEEALDARLRELTGLYRIFRLAQSERDPVTFARHVAAHTLRAMTEPARVRCVVAIDGLETAAGLSSAEGTVVAAPVFDGEASRGLLRVVYADGRAVHAEDQSFVNGAAQALGMWLRAARARREIEMFERIVASTRDCVALMGPDLCYRLANPAYAALVGRSVADIRGQPLASVLGAQLAQRTAARVRRALAGKDVAVREWRETPQGRRLMNFVYSPLVDNGATRGVIASGQDLTDLHDAQAGLRRAAQVFSSAVEAIFMTDLDGTITDVNDAFCRISGFAEAEVLGKNASVLSSGRHGTEFFRDMFARLSTSGEWRGELWNRRPSGEIYPCQMTVSAVVEEGEAQGYVAVFADVSLQKEYQQRLELLAHHDTLTGLPNRAQLSRRLAQTIELAQRSRTGFTIMFIDLDRFKEVNDSLGHAAGDDLLCEAARRLTGVLRVNDMLARVGGDEFVAILPGMAGSANASIVADKTLRALMAPFEIAGIEVKIAASIGICTYPDDGDTADVLLRNADTAMYRAKQEGRAGWCCYSADMTDKAARHLYILSGLRRALEQGELYLVYQPQYDLDNGAARALEALLRWRTPDGQPVETSEFISVAEEGGLVARLDSWVLCEACSRLGRWRRGSADGLRMVVNISGASLERPGFAAEVEQCLTAADMPAQALELQFREEVLHRRRQAQGDNLRLLASLGVGFSIDRFGTAYSSLLQLNATPVRRISIDASFTRNLDEDAGTTRVVEAIVALADSLSLEVVVHGLEKVKQTRYLRRFPRLLGQGFLLSPPLAEAQVDALLAAT